MSKHGIIGPYWFKNDDGHAVTINSVRYVEVLHKFWAELGQQRRFFKARQWFQQDGATPHTSDKSLAWLQQRFGGRLISRRCDPEWSAYSPDLNPLDFFLWGYLKDRVYQNRPETIEDLKQAIASEAHAIPRDMCKRVIDNFARRVQICLQRQGSHLEHLL